METLHYGGLSAGGGPVHQITQQLHLPSIAAALVERQVGATGDQGLQLWAARSSNFSTVEEAE